MSTCLGTRLPEVAVNQALEFARMATERTLANKHWDQQGQQQQQQERQPQQMLGVLVVGQITEIAAASRALQHQQEELDAPEILEEGHLLAFNPPNVTYAHAHASPVVLRSSRRRRGMIFQNSNTIFRKSGSQILTCDTTAILPEVMLGRFLYQRLVWLQIPSDYRTTKSQSMPNRKNTSLYVPFLLCLHPRCNNA